MKIPKPLKEENFNVEISYGFNGIIEELNLKIKTTAFRSYYGSYNTGKRTIEA